MHLLYPCSPLRSRLPDEQYQPEVEAVRAEGVEISLFSFENFQAGVFKACPMLPVGGEVLYRGWMLSGNEYAALVEAIEAAGCKAIIGAADYVACHHLPNWYPLLSEFTPETRVFSSDCDLAAELRHLGWSEFFIKDYVKSLKTSVGSRVSSPEQAEIVASEMRCFRGAIEGGFCVRQVENFLSDTERRYFVVNHTPCAATGDVPELVHQCAARIKSRFFSVDLVKRNDGQLRVVEVGDGQVSDLVGWTPEAFAKVLVQNLNSNN
jgi:hypothetical protein